MLKVCQQPGESVQGTIDVRPNAKNNRDLDIIIEYKVEGELSDGKTERIEYKMYAAALCRCKRADPNISGRDEGTEVGGMASIDFMARLLPLQWRVGRLLLLCWQRCCQRTARRALIGPAQRCKARCQTRCRAI